MSKKEGNPFFFFAAIIPIADYNITRFLLLILYEVKNDGIFNNNRNGQLSTVGRYMRLKFVQSFKDGKFPRKALLENGLKTVQGPTKATEQLIAYLEQ